jgi:hypothetical protein
MTTLRRLAAICCLLALVSLPVAARAATIVVLRGLDKTTARVSTFEGAAGSVIHFGTLAITVHDCRKHPPEEDPETAAFLDIDENLPGLAKPVHWFTGWMFASSPAVSALEHPVYDVWVLDCRIDTGSTPAPKSSGK